MSIDVLRRFQLIASDGRPARTNVDAGLCWARRLLCAVRGHEFLLHFGDRQLFLRCAGCGHQTPGWHIEQLRVRSVRRAFHRVEQKRAA